MLSAFAAAWQGIAHTVASGRNMRIHVVAASGAVIAGLLLRLGGLQWVCLVLTCAAVLSLELVNTAVEAIVDLVSPGYHPLAQVAKDAAAGAVLVAAAASLLVGGVLAIVAGAGK